MSINITRKQVGKIVKYGSKLVLGALTFLVLYYKNGEVVVVKDEDYEATYSDVFEAILNSAMLDSRKIEAIDIVERNQDSEYYKSVIMVIKSNMLDSRKIETIKKFSEK